MNKKVDFMIIGAGVVGLATGIALLERQTNLKVVICEKEKFIGLHASGRNSGVLHAGFYYSPDSLKAKFCREGNFEIRKLASEYNVGVKNTGKVVVATNAEELTRLEILHQRGIVNGVDLELLDENQIGRFEPLARTFTKFIWSPRTGVADPKEITQALLKKFLYLGGTVEFESKVSLCLKNGEIVDSSGRYHAEQVINAAGAQSDKIAKKVGVGKEYAMVPFMGVYRSTSSNTLPLRSLVYPVPHPVNPFLGVHFTITFDGKVKIGPTAIPIFGREQYSLFKGWNASDLIQTIKGVKALVEHDAHDLSAIISSEYPKFLTSKLAKEASKLVPSSLAVTDWKRRPPGIRSQLVNTNSGRLEQDFIVKRESNSTHVLNAVSPGWTSALPFGRWVAQIAMSQANI